MATSSKIVKLFSDYLGFTPSSSDLKKFSMMSSADVEDVLKNTKGNVQSEATKKAQDAVKALSGGSDYASSMMQGQRVLEEQYGMGKAKEQLSKSTDWANQLATKGPMFEQTMKTGLETISPKFLGSTRKDLEEFFSGIPDPFVRDKMVGTYLDSADKSMVANLQALNSLYQTSLISAQTAIETDQAHYKAITDKVKDLYTELQWVNRNRYEEEETERMEIKKSNLKKKEMEYEAGLKAQTEKYNTTFRETDQGLEQIVYDDRGNIIKRQVIGISGVNARKIREAIANFNSADQLLTQIESLSQSVIIAENAEQIPSQYIRGNIDAIAKFNPQATVFLSSIDAFSSMLTRAAGEKGVLTTMDVQRIINALPKLTDTKASANLKIKTLRSLYSSIKEGAIAAYTEPIPGTETTVTGDATIDLEGDIRDNAKKYNYQWGREKLIDELIRLYPEFTEEEISQKVYQITKELWGQ